MGSSAAISSPGETIEVDVQPGVPELQFKKADQPSLVEQ